MARLLATDLDGTFVGDDEATAELWSALIEAGIVVVFATGRHLRSIADLYRRWDDGRRADGCVTMVGTEIWHLDDSGYRRDETWTSSLQRRWDRARVDELVGECLDAEPQPAEWQSPVKSSWFVDGDEAGVERLRERLAGAGIDAKVVYSADRFVDVLPAAAGKGPAVAHLAAVLGVAPHDVVTAGDTGNDLDMMRPELGFRSVVVGNATAELAALEGDHVYRATAAHADGVAEGLRNLGWL